MTSMLVIRKSIVAFGNMFALRQAQGDNRVVFRRGYFDIRNKLDNR